MHRHTSLCCDQYGSLTTKDPQQNADSTTGTRYDFNYNSKVKQITDALTHVTTLAYGGANGGIDQLTAVKDPRQTARGASGKSTQFVFDKLGRVDKDIDPSGRTIHYTYFDNGLLKEKYDATATYPGMLLMSYTYNNRGQLLTKTRNSDGGYDQYTYKTNGFLDTATTTVKNPDNSFSTLISYSFDWYKNGWLKSVKDITAGLPGTPIASYDLYDGIGQRKTVTLLKGSGANERTNSYTYDTANRPETITTRAGAFTYEYDKLSRRKKLKYPTPAAPNNTVADYGFDDLNRLTSLKHTQAGNTITFSNYSTFDGAGNRKTKTTPSGTETYDYDAVYRLKQAVTPNGIENYTYDEVGNRLTGPGANDTAYAYNPDSNLMSSGRLFTYLYDNRGNQTTKTVPNGPDKTLIRTWDSENRLTKEERTKGNQKRTTTYSYDPFGRRIGKTLVITRDGIPATTKTTTWVYVYDGNNIALEIFTPPNGPVERTYYTHGPGIDEHLAMERNGVNYYFHSDGLNSITAITDANANIVQSYTYESFGLPTQTTEFRNSYQFAGREYDPETGLQHYDYRERDVLDGTFASPDPLGFGGGINLFSYTSSNPINYIDPDGLRDIACGGCHGTWSDENREMAKVAVGLPIAAALALESGGYLAPLVIKGGSALQNLGNWASSLFGTGKGNAGSQCATQGVDKVKYIGRLEDLKTIPRSQTFLDELPDLGSPKANYYQNMSVLRNALREGYVIRDASWFRPNSELAPTLLNLNRTVGQTFLGTERNLLNNRGLWP